MIKIKNLSKSFGKNLVLNDITETINQGDKVVIIGPSGSGKSTFLRCLNCMEDPTSGSIFFDGEDLVGRISHQGVAQGGLSGTVGSHQNVGLPGVHIQIDMMQQLSFLDRRAQVLYLQ